jgi:hypothetical protein
MKAPNRRESQTTSQTTEVLLRELQTECDRVVSLIRRLGKPRLSEKDRDEILGELSAAVLHLHTHTDGLDEFLCERA